MNRRYDIPLTEARSFAKKLAKELQGGEILALIGKLGSGKTTFTQSLGEALGVKQKILSPTFILMQEFKTNRKTKTRPSEPLWLVHADLYRTKSYQEIAAIGIPELWKRPNIITVLEWADKIKTKLPPSTIYIYLKRDAV